MRTATLWAGAFLIYGIPALFATAFWACVRKLARIWDGRDVMETLRPHRLDVADTDRELLKGTRHE